MAEKNNTSSLLEAIKNKLSKFDNKPKPEAKSSVNYFSQDLQSKAIDGVIADKTNIGLIFEAEKKLEAIDKKNLNLERNRPKDLDLDLDDESLIVKNLGQKISIESKIKEIADELNLEEFEDDFEDDKNAKTPKKIVEENNHQNLDPIDMELMELEKEISKNNQQNSQKNSEKEIAEDLNLKNYLDSKFEDEFKEIENKIKENQNAVNSDANKPEESLNEGITQEEKVIDKIDSSSSNIINSTSINPFFTKDQFTFKATPAQDFLASMQNKSLEENVEKTKETSFENIVEKNEETSANSPENIVENEVSEKPVEALNVNTSAQDFLASMPNKSLEENVEKTEETSSDNIAKNEVFEKPVENLNKITQKNNSQFTKPSIINQKISTVENTKFNEFNNSKDSKLKIENSDPKNPIFEKVNYNLIREEAVFQASNSMKKLMEAKNLVNNVGNFARDETLTKIAVSLMEPKLEKWLNDNLPTLVENIVREEIEKIVPKN